VGPDKRQHGEGSREDDASGPSFVVFECEHHCGFEGAYVTVATHEVRCAFFGRNLHSGRPLVPTPLLRLKRAGV
jgi:hypothetical protein